MTESNNSLVFNPSIIYDWERAEDPLAPLSKNQRKVVLDLFQEIKDLGPFSTPIKTERSKERDSVLNCSLTNPPVIESTREFLSWFSRKEDEWLDEEDEMYKQYFEHLEKRKHDCEKLLAQVALSLKNLDSLHEKYSEVSFKTNSLHQVSEALTSDQVKLAGIRDGILERLSHFKALDRITLALDSPILSIHSANIESMLDQIDQHIAYLESHKDCKESWTYKARYMAVLRRAVSHVRNSVTAGLSNAASQASTASAGHHAKFLAAAHSVRPLVALLETRTSPEYVNALDECRQCYVNQREMLISPSVSHHMSNLVAKGSAAGDHCALVRSACSFLIHICLDEVKLYHQFFREKTEIFNKYVESLCQSLYDSTRPIIIHMKHLETLAELCSILRLEMLQEHVANNRDSLSSFGNVIEQLLQDVQERLVFRAHMYVQNDIAEYNPSPGDLAYPEKLHMMQSIAESLQEQQMDILPPLSRSDSMASLASASSYQTTKAATNLTVGSPADLHGMWYPPVRRTLTCLSRMYRCVDRPIFQGISQEALSACITSVRLASTSISQSKTVLDGEMFLIKHLLILREQIAPFQVDFTVKEMSLDFSKMKTVAWELVSKRMVWNHNWLQLLLDGRPQVKERSIDSRKEVDSTLKSACEAFIGDAAKHLVGIPLLNAIETGDALLMQKEPTIQPNTPMPSPRDQWLKPDALSAIVQSSVKRIKANLPSLQSTMHLYLANKDTEFILYRPIKNSVIGCYSRLHQLMGAMGFSSDDFAQVGCPTPEQASILLSSASLQSEHTRSRRVSANQEPSRKISSISEPSKRQSLSEETEEDNPGNKSTNGEAAPCEVVTADHLSLKNDSIPESDSVDDNGVNEVLSDSLNKEDIPPSPNHFRPIAIDESNSPVIDESAPKVEQKPL